jgi:hypothetical protein
VAHVYGNLLRELGLLSKGEVVIKDPSDFVGDKLGEASTKTKPSWRPRGDACS